jgi:hypothetical protein
MKILLTAKTGQYSIVMGADGYEVVADDPDNEGIAAVAQRHAEFTTKLRYSPEMGEVYAFFAKAAAQSLGAQISSSIPAGDGELEKGLR